MKTYTVHTDGEASRSIARLVSERASVERLEARALGAAARKEDKDALETLAGDAGSGYFEVKREADDETVDAVISLLPSLTLAVFVVKEPVFARYDDGQTFVRVDDQTAEKIRGLAELERASFDDSAEVFLNAEGIED